VGGVTSEAASQASPKGFSLADIFKPFQLPISKVSSSDVLKALGKFLPVIYQKGITSNQTLNCPTCPEAPYHIGDFAQGGVIIWLTQDGLHGLVAATRNVLIGTVNDIFRWSIPKVDTLAQNNNPLPYSTPNFPYGNYYGGYLNQEAIQKLNNWQNDYPAFKAAADYSITIKGVKYDDWWLPSAAELGLMYAFRDVINQVSIANGGGPIRTDTNLWSSFSTDTNEAFYLTFNLGVQFLINKNTEIAVRCVRAF
jgi:hypothetical protein